MCIGALHNRQRVGHEVVVTEDEEPLGSESVEVRSQLTRIVAQIAVAPQEAPPIADPLLLERQSVLE
jgi:hypothetical protein